ncbi:MAG TPA: hypothetical protein VK253_04240 [Candidatus Binatia bacterium]|nr:hypothetical protein [Candidatus Binatia bacterium]
MLRDEAEFAEENEETSGFEMRLRDMRPVEVSYNQQIPIEMFDIIITDECHRAIYHLWHSQRSKDQEGRNGAVGRRL